MKLRKRVQNGIFMALTGLILVFSAIFSSTVNTSAISTPVNSLSNPAVSTQNSTQNTIKTAVSNPLSSGLTILADLDNPTETPTETPTEEATEETKSAKKSKKDDVSKEEAEQTCYDQVDAIGWLICPSSGVIAKAVDGIYSVIKDIIVVQPMSNDENNPIYTIWQYARDITNIVFVIMILIVIYSQITGVGFDNYNIKKTLPRIVIAAMLVNFSFLICSALVDFSNILGTSIRSFFETIELNAIGSGAFADAPSVTWGQLAAVLTGSGAVGTFAISATGGVANFLWMLIPVLISALLAIVTGLITISLRQAVVFLLVMIAPLAFVCYLLPNTEKWFKKWKDLLFSMLIFFPAFSLLFGASHLAGWAIIASSTSAFGLIIGMAVQVIPLFLSVSLMKMSGTVLGTINNKLNSLSSGINNAVKPWATDHAETAKARQRAEALKRNFNPLSGASYAAWMTTEKAKRAASRQKNEETAKALVDESVLAQRSGRRIVGRRENGAPIYASHVVRRKDENGNYYSSREDIVRENRHMNEEFANREAKLRLEGAQMQLDNAMSNIGAYMTEHDFNSKKLEALSRQQGQNYLELRKQMSAKARNNRADERFYNDAIRKAAERDERTGRIVNQALYDKYIKGGAGGDAWSDDESISKNALTTVIADSYDSYDKAMKETTDKYTTYFDKQVTKNVLTNYKDALTNQSTEAVVAAQNILARRGDYDKINDYLMNYLDHTKSIFNDEADFSNLNPDQYMKLGTDFSNAVALNLLSMKDSAGTLGRLAKSINMETWRYSNGNRATADFKFRDFYYGDQNGGNNQARTSMAALMEGTNLSKMDRTGFEAWSQIIKHYETQNPNPAYTDPELAYSDAFNDQINPVIPQLISAIPTYETNGESMMSVLKFMTGLKYNTNSKKWEKQNDEPIKLEAVKSYIGGLTDKDFNSFKTNAFQAVCEAIAQSQGITCYAPDPNTGETKFMSDLPTVVKTTLRSFANQNMLNAIQNNIDHGNNSGMKDSIMRAFGFEIPKSNNGNSSP